MVINMMTGQSEVLMTHAELIDWLRAQNRFLSWGNNGLSRSIAYAYKSYGLEAELTRSDVSHMGANAKSPLTFAEFQLSWPNLIKLLARL
jgi:hypothetical protein